MLKNLSAWLLTACLISSCSLLQRDIEDLEGLPSGAASEPPFSREETAETLESLATAPESMESEISRLNTKVSALETKLDVLTANIERAQMQRSQPIIEAQGVPQLNMAAPVAEDQLQETESIASQQISAAPMRPTALPAKPKSAAAGASAPERDFRMAMELFQNGKNMEAAAQFMSFAERHPKHLLASHSLYWAGEAGARAEQWTLAQENWSALERSYPRSAYLPEALSGLARAHEKLGNAAQAKAYRDSLLRAFPKSPVVLSLQASPAAAESHAPSSGEGIPAYEDSGAGE